MNAAKLVPVEGPVGAREQLPEAPAQFAQHGLISSLLKAMARMSAK
jgi:hypothetical protein